MEPPELPAAQAPSRILVLPPLLEAIDAWQSAPTAERRRDLARALEGVARVMGLIVETLHLSAPPLPELDLDLGSGSAGAKIPLRMPDDEQPVGLVSIAGDSAQATALAHALERGFLAARVRSHADRATRQLTALDQAIRGISGMLDVDRVLQLITDRVRDLVNAQYAAIGIVDDDGTIERFITSGISDEDRARIGDLPRGRGLLGLIIRENATYRIGDIGAHAESYGFPPQHPEMHSFLGMPITVSDAVVGRLYLTNKLEAAEFSAGDQALVEMFALHAGIAIQNARLNAKVRGLAIAVERDRISRDLHDGVIQAIYAQTLALDDVPDLIAVDADEATRRVDVAIDALHAVIRDIRNFIFGLRPVLLETGSLADGLRHLATELRRNGAVDVSVSIADDAEGAPDPPIEVVAELLAVTREALSNIARHASATRASVDFRATPRLLRLELADDGHGFDAERIAQRGHHGLANMRARIEGLTGTFAVRSRPDSGTRIIISVPRRVAATDGDDE